MLKEETWACGCSNSMHSFLNLFEPPVLEIDFFIIDHFMVKSVLF